MFPALETVTTVHPVVRAKALWSASLFPCMTLFSLSLDWFLPSKCLSASTPLRCRHRHHHHHPSHHQHYPASSSPGTLSWPPSLVVSYLSCLLHYIFYIGAGRIFSKHILYISCQTSPVAFPALRDTGWNSSRGLCDPAASASALCSLLLCKPLPLSVSALVPTFSPLCSPCSSCHRASALNVLLSSLPA